MSSMPTKNQSKPLLFLSWIRQGERALRHSAPSTVIECNGSITRDMGLLNRKLTCALPNAKEVYSIGFPLH